MDSAQFTKFPSIEQLRSAVKDMKYHDSGPVRFEGTVKIHGTNAGIFLDAQDRLIVQSRNNILSVNDQISNDNAGFASWVKSNSTHIRAYLEQERKIANLDSIGVYGEWFGPGIQKGVAVSEIPSKTFAVFEKVRGNGTPLPISAFDSDTEKRFFATGPIESRKGINNTIDIHWFGRYNVTIDPQAAHLIQDKLIQLTLDVENECPAGKFYGISGIGEGIVWRGYKNNISFMFKTKGEKHSVSRVKTLVAVDVEKIENLREFVRNTVTENRMNQGLEYLREQQLPTDTMKSFGDFMRWLIGDIVKEETDTMEANGIEPKNIGN